MLQTQINLINSTVENKSNVTAELLTNSQSERYSDSYLNSVNPLPVMRG